MSAESVVAAWVQASVLALAVVSASVLVRILVAPVLESAWTECNRKDMILITVQLLSMSTSYLAGSLILF